MIQHGTVFVTGGTGFVGAAIVRSLREAGIPVIALVRKSSRPESREELIRLGARLAEGDLLSPASWRGPLEESVAVFHAAAIHDVRRPDPALVYETNVEATKRLFLAAAARGVRQFIYTSSVKTIGSAGPGKTADEDTPYNLGRVDGVYGRSKYEAEQFLLARGEPVAVKILNPAAAIGPGDGSLTPTVALIARFLRGMIAVSLDTSMGLVDVRDVGAAHVLALEHAAPKRKYILCAGNITLDGLFGRLRELTGIPLPMFHLPYPAAFAAAYLGVALGAVIRRSPPVTPESLRVARLKPAFDGSRAERELGLRYRDLNASIKDTVEWLKKAQRA